MYVVHLYHILFPCEIDADSAVELPIAVESLGTENRVYAPLKVFLDCSSPLHTWKYASNGAVSAWIIKSYVETLRTGRV